MFLIIVDLETQDKVQLFCQQRFASLRHVCPRLGVARSTGWGWRFGPATGGVFTGLRTLSDGKPILSRFRTVEVSDTVCHT